jgi:hypothetical protein
MAVAPFGRIQTAARRRERDAFAAVLWRGLHGQRGSHLEMLQATP